MKAQRSIIVQLLCLVVLARTALARNADATPGDIRRAINRSMPFLAKQGEAWIKERGACVSCHQTAFLIWTHAEASRRGFPVDRPKLDGWTDHALLGALAMQDGYGDAAPDTLAQLLLGRDAGSSWFKIPPRWHHRTSDPYENVLQHLLKAQQKDGSWLAGGQSKNPPEIPTSWALLALAARNDFVSATGPATEGRRDANAAVQKLLESNDAALPAAITKALEFLQSQQIVPASDWNERLVLRALVARKFGSPEDAAARWRELLERQHADGGWSSDLKPDRPSDAFATGQSLYALDIAGQDLQKPAVRRAANFLWRTQQPNGAWIVPTTAFHPLTGDAKRDAATDDVYTYWGTAWAALGLLRLLPEDQIPK